MKKVNQEALLKNAEELDVNTLMNYFKAHGSVFFSWGANDFTVLEKKVLRFKVNGFKHKGYVFIRVVNDTFEIVLTDGMGVITHEDTDIYIDNLFDILDSLIEK